MNMNTEPYVGLRPFTEADSGRFFGRDRDIESLLNLIYTSSTVVVFAPSGVGKTSLLRAGVITQLRSDRSVYVVYINDWTEPLLEQVHAALRGAPDCAVEKRSSDPGMLRVRRHKTAQTVSDQNSLLTVVREFRARTNLRPILILDQFEEIERYQGDPTALWDELAPLMNVDDQPAHVVLSLREDHLGMLNDLMGRVPGLMETRFRIQSLSEEGIGAAIRKPLQVLPEPYGIDDELVACILRDFESRRKDIGTSGRVEAGYLQLVCQRLWNLEKDAPGRRLRLETYMREGGIEQIVESHIRRALDDSLDDGKRHLLYAMMRYLVTPTGAKLSLAVSDLAQLVVPSDFTTEGRKHFEIEERPGSRSNLPDSENGRSQIEGILEALCKGSVFILRRKEFRDRVTYELCHDVLGGILLRWRTSFLEGEARRARMRLSEALDAYKAAIRDHPENVVARSGYAEVLKGLNRLPEALDAYETGMRDHPEDVVAKTGRAEVLKAMNRLPEALDAYQAAMRDHPENVVAKTGCAEVLKAMNRLPEALDVYQTAMRDHPESVVVKNGCAEVLKAMNRLPEALEAYKSTMRDHPEDIVAVTGFAEVLKAMNRLPEALGVYKAIIRDHSEDAVARVGFAEMLKAMNRLPEALAAYQAALRDQPEDVVTKTGYAELLKAMNRLPEALDFYKAVMRDHPEDVVAKIGFAEVLKAMNRLPEALEAYRMAMCGHPEGVVAKIGFAEVLKAMNRLPEALEAYQMAMCDHPEDVTAKNGCASVLAIMEKWGDALALLPDSAPITPDDWLGYHIRGMILLRTGSIDAAIEVFQKGIRENPRPASADYFRTALAVAQLRLGQYQAACATLQQVTSPEASLPADVLRVHALGEMRSSNVGEAYERISGELPPVTAELRDEFRRRYLTGEHHQHDAEWIYQRECLMLMAA